MDKKKILSLVGFAKRANKLSSGTNRVTDSIKKNHAKLIILAEDLANNTKEKIEFYAEKKEIPIVVVSTIEELSKISGEENKGTYAVLDSSFSKAIMKLTEDNMDK